MPEVPTEDFSQGNSVLKVNFTPKAIQNRSLC